jgi:hypothetical protein
MMCDECLTIAQYLREAIAELRLSAERGRPEAFRIVEALRRGTEEDAILVEEFFSAGVNRGQTAPWSIARSAMSQMFEHQRRTGHRLNLERPAR